MEQSATPQRNMRLAVARQSIVNLAALTAIQVSSAVTPVIIYPLILIVLGAEPYAQIVLAESIALLLLTFVLYSFEIDGVAAVVGLKHDQDREDISRALSEIMVLRTAFYVVGLLAIEVGAFFFYPDLMLLIFGWSLSSLAYALQPNWLYLALERNLPLAVCVVASRIGALACVLLASRFGLTAEAVTFLIGGWSLAGGVAAGGFAIWHFGLTLQWPRWPRLRALIWGGKEVFLGNFATAIYRDSNVLFLSAFTVSPGGIVVYSLAEKFTKAIQASIRPLNQFFFPRALAVTKAEERPSVRVLRSLLRLTLPQEAAVFVVLLGAGAVFLLASRIWPEALAQPDIVYAAKLTALMSLSTLAGIAVFMLGSAGLNTLGQRRYMLVALTLAALFSVVANLALVPVFEEVGSAICFVLSEAMLLALVIRRYRLNSAA